jgi:NMD protein affecting ribosome stability and mRNA decay
MEKSYFCHRCGEPLDYGYICDECFESFH